MLPVCAVLLINNLLVPSYLLFSFTCPMIIHPSMLSQPFIVDALALLVYKSTTLDKTIPSFIILIIPLQSVTHCMLFAYRSRLINCKMSARRLILLFIHNSQLNTSLVFSFAPCPTMDDGLTLTWLTWQQEREREGYSGNVNVGKTENSRANLYDRKKISETTTIQAGCASIDRLRDWKLAVHPPPRSLCTGLAVGSMERIIMYCNEQQQHSQSLSNGRGKMSRAFVRQP